MTQVIANKGLAYSLLVTNAEPLDSRNGCQLKAWRYTSRYVSVILPPLCWN